MFGNENYRPVYTPVGTFSNNTAHSINQRGIVFYSDGQGWQPSSESLIANSKVYRNSLEGYFIHGNRNILVKGGLVADHGCGIRQFRDGDTRIEDVKVVGFSENYASVMREANAGTLCPNNSIVGLATDTWRNVAGTTFGLQTSNVEFSRLGTDICGPASTAISIGKL